MLFEDLNRGIKALITFDTTRNESYFKWKYSGIVDGIDGLIYQSKHKVLLPTKFGTTQKLPVSIDKIKDLGKKLSTISGCWLGQLLFDD